MKTGEFGWRPKGGKIGVEVGADERGLVVKAVRRGGESWAVKVDEETFAEEMVFRVEEKGVVEKVLAMGRERVLGEYLERFKPVVKAVQGRTVELMEGVSIEMGISEECQLRVESSSFLNKRQREVVNEILAKIKWSAR